VPGASAEGERHEAGRGQQAESAREAGRGQLAAGSGKAESRERSAKGKAWTPCAMRFARVVRTAGSWQRTRGKLAGGSRQRAGGEQSAKRKASDAMRHSVCAGGKKAGSEDQKRRCRPLYPTD